MPDARRRLRASVFVALATIIVVGFAPTASATTGPSASQARFMWALGKVESGGRYNARNSVTGAYGKYQILPSTWRAWARAYLGNANARMTPHNQELVASRKVAALWRVTHDWRVVAGAWLVGHPQRNPASWSAQTRRYIDRVMARLRGAPTKAGSGSSGGPVGSTSGGAAILVDDRAASIAYRGTWRSAGYGAYVGGGVHYATERGATATFSFSGRRITWLGPVGPTRGAAQVFIDGRFAKTVDLYAGSFHARTAAFSAGWGSTGRHTITIRVLGSPGHPLVAIDAFEVLP